MLYYLLIAHTLACWAVLQASLPAILPLLAICLYYYLHYWYRWSYGYALLFKDNACLIEQQCGKSVELQLGQRHFISNFLIIIQLQDPQRRKRCYRVLFRDALDAETFRRLRVLLRFPVFTASKTGNSAASE